MERLGSCSLTRRFRGVVPIWWCDPRRCANLKSSTVAAIQLV